ncbi:MAG: hypothetical protein AAF614_24670 [Chloroflexota bacterium]
MGDPKFHGGEKKNRRSLLVAALSTPCDEATYQQCLSQLPDYIAAQLAGEDVVKLFPETAVLLDACPACAAAYAHLYELDLAIANDQLPEPARQGKPNLGFLKTDPLLSRLRDAIVQTVDKLSLQLTRDLVALLTPSPMATVRRAPQNEQRYSDKILRLDEKTVAMELPILLEAYQDNEAPENCLVEVTIFPDDMVGKHVVRLLLGEHTETATASWGGVVSFENIPIELLPKLKIEVTPQKG